VVISGLGNAVAATYSKQAALQACAKQHAPFYFVACTAATARLSCWCCCCCCQQIKCPDTKKACPGNTAVTIFTKFANTAEQFQAQQPTFIAGIAKAASVSPLQVVITNVKLLYTPKPPSPPPAAAAVEAPAAEPAAAAAEPAAEPAAAEGNATAVAPAAATAKAAAPAAKPAANATAAAKPAPAPKAKPESAPLRKLLRVLFQAKEEPAAAAAAPAEEEPPAAGADAAPASNKTEEPAAEPAAAAEEKPSLDAAAIVEELPGGPKPLIEVMTSIQPLTEEEAQSVLGTTGSPYFIKTFKETLTATNLTLTEDIVTKIAEPAKEFEWPKPEEPEAEANLSKC
jgi:hypothetical protein